MEGRQESVPGACVVHVGLPCQVENHGRPVSGKKCTGPFIDHYRGPWFVLTGVRVEHRLTLALDPDPAGEDLLLDDRADAPRVSPSVGVLMIRAYADPLTPSATPRLIQLLVWMSGGRA